MNLRFNHPHILLALAATLVLAGLFYLPYLSVRSRTVDTFHNQQRLLAGQAAEEFQRYFSTYEKALVYLADQNADQGEEKDHHALLEHFFVIHRAELVGIQRTDASCQQIFATPEDLIGADGERLREMCRQAQHLRHPAISEPLGGKPGADTLAFAAPVFKGERFDGCVVFTVPYERISQGYMSSLRLPSDSTTLLFSQEGRILYSQNPAQRGRSVSSFFNDSKGIDFLKRKMNQQEQGMVELEVNPFAELGGPSGNSYGVLFPVALPGKTYWSMLILTPTDTVLGSMAGFRTQWLLVTGAAIFLVGMFGILLNSAIVRRREEQQQREAEAQLVQLLENVPMGVFLVNADGRLSYANRAAVDLIEGNDCESLVDSRLLDLFTEDCRPVVAERLLPLSGTRPMSMPPLKVMTLAGRLRDTAITAAPIQLVKQRQLAMILRDVTEELKTEELQRQLVAAIDQVKEAVVFVDRNGSIDYVNAAFVQMTGYEPEESLGLRVERFLADDDNPMSQQIAASMAEGRIWQGRLVNRRKDGTFFVTAATVSPVRNVVGKITHAAIIQRDITHEVEFETRIHQAQKMEAIGTLAGGIAHDFNNILGAIIGFTDMALLQCDRNSELYQTLKHVLQGGKRAADLVQQILTFSRQTVEERVPVLVAPLIKESLKLLRASLPTTIEIRQDLRADRARVLAAPVHLQQIVMNLCTNAFYSMREKGGTLTLVLAEETTGQCGASEPGDGPRWLTLTVRDTGQGIDNEIIGRIFTPFFTTKQPGEGTGMGLSVVHGIVKELGGEISVESEVGRGAVFTVCLPLADDQGEGILASGEEPMPMGCEHILVVDDERDIREICRMMLKHLGYQVTTTGNPAEAVSLIYEEKNRIDLVISDQTMPKMTGMELIREVRQIRPEVPVILCTGYSDRLNYEIAREAGAWDFVMKPLDLRGLGTAVRTALDGRKRQEEENTYLT